GGRGTRGTGRRGAGRAGGGGGGPRGPPAWPPAGWPGPVRSAVRRWWRPSAGRLPAGTEYTMPQPSWTDRLTGMVPRWTPRGGRTAAVTPRPAGRPGRISPGPRRPPAIRRPPAPP